MDPQEGLRMLENAPWLDANWMWVSLVLGAVTLIFLLMRRKDIIQSRGGQFWYGLLLCAIYSVHQLEEHGYDIYGRQYMFVPMMNANIGTKLGVSVNPRQTTYINMLGIWVSIPLCAYFSNAGNKYVPLAASWGMAIVNGGFGHLLPLTEGKYMPGAVQSAFMVPFGLWVLLSVHGRFSWVHKLILPLIGGFLFHAVGLVVPLFFFPNGSELILPAFVLFGGVVIPVVMGKLCYRPEIPL